MTGWGEGVRGLKLGAAALLAIAVAGCSSSPVDSTPPPSGGSSFRDRMSNLFFGSPGTEAQALAVNAADPNQDCPVADIRSGASTLQVNAGTDTSANTLRYQATIARLARECAVRGPTMTVKVGVQGRVVIGPMGGPGQIEVPLRYALVHEGPEPKTILTKFYRFPVTIAEGQGNVPFLHIDEDITFTVPPRGQLDNYVVYVGFDPAAAAPPKQPPAKKARRSG
jgi:hypothetical protein